MKNQLCIQGSGIFRFDKFLKSCLPYLKNKTEAIYCYSKKQATELFVNYVKNLNGSNVIYVMLGQGKQKFRFLIKNSKGVCLCNLLALL